MWTKIGLLNVTCMPHTYTKHWMFRYQHKKSNDKMISILLLDSSIYTCGN